MLIVEPTSAGRPEPRSCARRRRVMTDNAKNYGSSRAFASGARRDRRPPPADPAVPAADQRQGRCSTSGPARGRTTRTTSACWLRPWLDHDNHDRPHSALGGLSPMHVLVNNVSGDHT